VGGTLIRRMCERRRCCERLRLHPAPFARFSWYTRFLLTVCVPTCSLPPTRATLRNACLSTPTTEDAPRAISFIPTVIRERVRRCSHVKDFVDVCVESVVIVDLLVAFTKKFVVRSYFIELIEIQNH